MGKYIIVAESGSDLSPDMIKQHQIQVGLMHVAINEADYADGSISMEELCGYYDKTGNVPKTSAVSPHDYQEIFEKIVAEHPEAIILHISYSSKLSATFQNALIADDNSGRIYHLDSLNASIGQAYVVMKTVRLIEEYPHITPEEVRRRVDEYAAATRFSFVPGNLDYLRAGGRVSNAQYLGATLFGIKPLIEMIDGNMISTKKYRGAMKGIARQMIKEFFNKFNIDKELIFLAQSYKLSDEIRVDIENYLNELNVKKIVWLKLGSVITSHSGPGAVGIAGIENLKTVR